MLGCNLPEKITEDFLGKLNEIHSKSFADRYKIEIGS
jgi:hypothetical protein